MSLSAGFTKNDVRLAANFSTMMLRDRFLGSSLGLIWAVLQPGLLIAIFVFVFTVIFPARLPGNDSSLAYVIWLVSGYGPWLATADGLGSATSSVTGQSGLIKNLAFKTELLPISATVAGSTSLLVSIVVLAALLAIDGRAPSIAWTALPFVLLAHTTFVAGLGMILGALNVFMRDVALVLPNVLTMTLFLSPIFYPIASFPKPIRDIAQWNPFYVVANCYRVPILDGKFPYTEQFLYLCLVSATTFFVGILVFRQLKTYFHGRL